MILQCTIISWVFEAIIRNWPFSGYIIPILLSLSSSPASFSWSNRTIFIINTLLLIRLTLWIKVTVLCIWVSIIIKWVCLDLHILKSQCYIITNWIILIISNNWLYGFCGLWTCLISISLTFLLGWGSLTISVLLGTW